MAYQITNNSNVCSTACANNNETDSRTIGLWKRNPLVSEGFPSQKASNAERVSMSWHHNLYIMFLTELFMITSSDGNIFRVTGHFCGEFTGDLRGIHRSPVNSPHKGQWRGALMLFLICAWINCWVNNHGAGDLRGYRAHNDVIVM